MTGVLAARRAGRLESSLLAAWCGLAAAFQYLFLVNYAAPRFLLPAYLLLAIPVADALGFVVAGPGGVRARPAGIAAVGLALATQLLVQQVVLAHQVREKVGFFGAFRQVAADLHGLGVRPPCLVKGPQYIPVAYYAGCASAPSVRAARRAHPRMAIAVLVRPGQAVPGYARRWPKHHVSGVRSGLLRVKAYVAPGSG